MNLHVLVLFSFVTLTLSAEVEPILSQFQDVGLQGQYKFGYQSGVERKAEHRTPDGTTIGSYSYVDDHGKLQNVKYSAGVEGFKVLTSDSPTPVASRPHFPGAQITGNFGGDTPEVEAARRQHLAAYDAALRVLPKIQEHTQPIHHHSFQGPISIPTFDSQGTLVDTPEVAAAKAQHAAAHAEVRKYLPITPSPVPQVRFPSLHHTSTFDTFPRQTNAITKFAEDIPRSALGETPEVAAAREAHLAFYAKIKSELPGNSARPQFPAF